MAEDWLVDVRKYDADADENVVKKIVTYCGIALRKRDSSLVSFSDAKETDRVREGFLKKKLALTDPDATLDAAIAAVGERMQADRTKNRVTVYYLLTDHFDKFDLFGGVKRGAGAALAAAGAATLATGAAAASTPPPAAASGGGGGTAKPAHLASGQGRSDDDFDMVSFGCLALAVVIGVVLFAMVASGWLFRDDEPDAPAAPAAAVAPAVPAAAPLVPDGAGVIAAEREEKPMLTVYFDVGKADVTPDFAGAAADLLAYLEANPDATLAISGFNDPTGDAALNAELSKNRAQSVQLALVALGVEEGQTDLVKPDDTTSTDVTAEEARRVEVTIVE